MVAILVAGLATIDFLFSVDAMPTRAEKYRATDAEMVGGGGAANAAVAVVRLGGGACLAAQIGTDRVGDMILADAQGEHVDTSLVYRTPGARSAFSSVLIDAQGERQIVNFRGSPGDALPDFDAAPPCHAILTDTRFPALTRAALALARERGIPGVVDGEHPVDLAHLTQATHIAFSAQGLVGLTGIEHLPDALSSVAGQTGAWVCVTDGANGVRYRRGDDMLHIPAYEVEAVDTLGAGDVWHGAFVLRLAEGATEPEAVDFANAAASLKCLRRGGRNGCPDRMTVDSFLRNARPVP